MTNDITEARLKERGFKKVRDHYELPVINMWQYQKPCIFEAGNARQTDKWYVVYKANGYWASDNIHDIERVDLLYNALTGREIEIIPLN